MIGTTPICGARNAAGADTSSALVISVAVIVKIKDNS
jgi:hypothetical protein